jgi:hypothetical protein
LLDERGEIGRDLGRRERRFALAEDVDDDDAVVVRVGAAERH